mgnify:FL=1
MKNASSPWSASNIVTRRRKVRPSHRDSNRSCPRLNQWQWLRHMARCGKSEVMAKATGTKEKQEIIESLIAIDEWLESRFNTRFEIPMIQDR